MLALARSSRSVLGRSLLARSIPLLTRPLAPRINRRLFSTTPAPRYSAEFTQVGPDGQKVQQHPPDESVFQLNTQNWEEKILKGSQEVPVLIECSVASEQTKDVVEYKRHLADTVRKEGGALKLGKLDVISNPTLAEDLAIQDVPTLLLVSKGNLLQKLVGVHPPKVIDDFVTAVMFQAFYPELKKFLEEGDALFQEHKLPEAAAVYHSILTSKKFKAEALALCGLAQCALKEGNVETAQALVKQANEGYPRFANYPYVKQVTSQVQLHKQGHKGGDQTELLKKIEADPNDLQARQDLAIGYAQAGDYEKCFEQLFQSIKIDREWNQQAAKTLLIETITSLGDSDLAKKGRKGLQNVWFR